MPATEEENLRDLAERLGVGSKELLEEALIHPTNKRLGWIGDAVLYLAVTEHLYKTSNAPTRDLDPKRQDIIENPNLKEAVLNQLHLNVHAPSSERDPRA